MKFKWLVRVYPWVNPIVFGNNWANRTNHWYRENVPSKQGFRLSFSQYGGFWREDLETAFGTLFTTEKVVFIFVVDASFPQKWSCLRKFFHGILEKNIVFFKKIVEWKIFKISFSIKKVILIFVARCPFPFKIVMSFDEWFFAAFFPKILLFSKNLSNT